MAWLKLQIKHCSLDAISQFSCRNESNQRTDGQKFQSFLIMCVTGSWTTRSSGTLARFFFTLETPLPTRYEACQNIKAENVSLIPKAKSDLLVIFQQTWLLLVGVGPSIIPLSLLFSLMLRFLCFYFRNFCASCLAGCLFPFFLHTNASADVADASCLPRWILCSLGQICAASRFTSIFFFCGFFHFVLQIFWLRKFLFLEVLLPSSILSDQLKIEKSVQRRD